MKTILVTGGAGFLGHHVIEYLLRFTDCDIVSLDRLDTSGNLNRLSDLECWDKKRRVKVLFGDLRASISDLLATQIGKPNIILHLAASTHVDRSISDPVSFAWDNVMGTTHLLDYAKGLDSVEKFVFFGTDEVFGPAPPGTFYREDDRYRSGNPYAASKAGAEEMCVAFENTYGMPVLIVHSMNLFGERQHREKFIPHLIRTAMTGGKVTIHANADCTQSGSRCYIHARNVADALWWLMNRSQCPLKINVVGEREVSNLELAKLVTQMVWDINGKTEVQFEMVDFHSSRPGHDLRYALDGSRLRELGWIHPRTFEDSLRKTVHWTVKNASKWL